MASKLFMNSDITLQLYNYMCLISTQLGAINNKNNGRLVT